MYASFNEVGGFSDDPSGMGGSRYNTAADEGFGQNAIRPPASMGGYPPMPVTPIRQMHMHHPPQQQPPRMPRVEGFMPHFATPVSQLIPEPKIQDIGITDADIMRVLSAARSSYDCKDAAAHVKECIVCSRLYESSNFIYVATIIVLAALCVYLIVTRNSQSS